MITYSKVGAKVWKIVPHFQPLIDRELQREEIERMDQEIHQWYASCPSEVQISDWADLNPMPSTPSYNIERLRIWTRLRYNQIRIWLYTPVLHTNASIMRHQDLAHTAVSLAQDTIGYLAHLNNTSNIYRKIQIFYHQFLTSAIAVLFLASVHAPVQFSESCRHEFYRALELVRDLSAKSWVSHRLWQTIRSLKDLGRPLGLVKDDDGGGCNRNATSVTAHASASIPAPPGSVNSATIHAASPCYSTTEKPASGGVSSSSTPAALDASVLTTTSVTSGGHAPLATSGPHFPDTPRTVTTTTPGKVVALDNGALLESEMRKIFENYTGMNGFPPPHNESSCDNGQGGSSSVSTPFAYEQGQEQPQRQRSEQQRKHLDVLNVITGGKNCVANSGVSEGIEEGSGLSIQPISVKESVYGSFAQMF